MSPGRLFVTGAAAAAAVFLAYHLLHRGSHLSAPKELGSMTLLQANPPELREARSNLDTRGVHDALLALYGPAGSDVAGTSSGFVLLAARTSAPPADLQQAMSAASAVSGGMIRPFTERLGGSSYTCGTLQTPRGESTTCFWQGRRAVVMGVGYRIDGTTTIALTAFAKIQLRLAD